MRFDWPIKDFIILELDDIRKSSILILTKIKDLNLTDFKIPSQDIIEKASGIVLIDDEGKLLKKFKERKPLIRYFI